MHTLPDHVPIGIHPENIEQFRVYLESQGYRDTFFQLRKPRQLFGYIKEVKHGDKEVEHHVRCYTDGTILTEVELKRIDEMWLHLTSRSISAHEKVIPMLETLDIDYTIDGQLRTVYREYGPEGFVRDHMEFFRWLVYGVIFWMPLGYLWMFSQNLKVRFQNGNGVHHPTTNGVPYRSGDVDSDILHQ
ncbi:MAG: hypothetical protein ACXAE3_12520 [Candidatus Kariarchaeaceae archaeon]